MRHGFKGDCHAGRCWLSLLLLRILSEKPMHGYALMEALEKRGYAPSGSVEAGTLYTILRRMERRGLLKSSWDRPKSGRPRRVYQVTHRGLEFLKSGLEALAERQPIIEELLSFYHRRFGSDG